MLKPCFKNADYYSCSNFTYSLSKGPFFTGHGETILKYCLAHSIIRDIESGKTSQDATKLNIEKMTERLKNTAGIFIFGKYTNLSVLSIYYYLGAITLSKKGDVGVFFSSKRMAWACQSENEVSSGINHGDHQVEKV